VEGHLFQFAVLFGVLGVAAALSLWVRFPVVPLYIACGIGLGSLVEGNHVIEFLGSLGVVFLLFSMGLEFSLASLRESPARLVGPGLVDFAFNFPVGLAVGLALGWSWVNSLFLAGITYMSSTAVVSKCLADFGRAARPETETILNVMVFQDLLIAAYLLVLNALTSGETPGAWGYALSLGRAAVFVGFLVVVARRFSAPLARALATRSEESFTLLLFAFALLVASASIAVGLSEAVGAFLAGLVIGSTHLKQRAAHVLSPFLTLFAALFFVSFGAGIHVHSLLGVLLPGALLVGLGVATKAAGGFVGGRLAGHTPLQATAVAFSLVPRGEFSILMAALAASLGGAAPSMEPLAALYVLALSLLGPLLMRESDAIWLALERRLPRRAARAARRGSASATAATAAPPGPPPRA
jgi:CPA2 family monovalent cation:H+ antiporter-2